jgi:sulfofructose kinase
LNSPKVLCVGVITVDTIALVDKYPAEDERVVAERVIRAGGGPASVAAVTLARLGISTAISGVIGDDEDGQFVLEIFKSEGIDISGISVGENPTAGSVVVVSKEHQSRAISTRQPPLQVKPNSKALEIARSTDWLHVDQVGVKQLSALGITRGMGPKISFDAGYDIAEFDSSSVDLFAPTDKSLLKRNSGLALENALKKEGDYGKNYVVASQGSHGSSGYSTKDGLVVAKPFSVEVVSTLGAGDVFHGALVAQMCENRTFSEALRRANAVAALSCRGLDGQSAIPNSVELEKFLKENS